MPYERSAPSPQQAVAKRLSRLPSHCREAGIRRAEKALEELTDAAGQLNVGDILTGPIVFLWDALHTGHKQRIAPHKTPMTGKAPVLDKPTLNPTQTAGRRPRFHMNRIESPEGQQALQDVLRGLISLREAARKLGVHPGPLCIAARRLREQAQQKQDACPAGIELSFS